MNSVVHYATPYSWKKVYMDVYQLNGGQKDTLLASVGGIEPYGYVCHIH